MKTIVVVCLLLIFTATIAQDKSIKFLPRHQFDFWLGEWEFIYNDTVKGSNLISKELNGFVIQEIFHDPQNKYTGRSWSVLDTNTGKWRQTWVDNQGAYLEFTGEWMEDKMELSREFTSMAGKTVKQRMIFYNITQNSFEWDWQSSNDLGATWNTNWKIFYKRKI